MASPALSAVTPDPPDPPQPSAALHGGFEVLRRRRDVGETRSALAEMRERQRSQRDETILRRILGNLQFAAELGILLEAHREPGLCEVRGLTAQLEALTACGWLPPDRCSEMVELQTRTASLRDRSYLERTPASDDADLGARLRRLEALRAEGLLSDEEYGSARARILSAL